MSKMEKKQVLRLIELFASVQGESYTMGFPTTFIRLASCNLRCTWCDTTYSFGRGEEISLDEILNKVREFACPYVCITGGEPLLQPNVHLLMSQLCSEGYRVTIETGGSLDIQPIDPRVTTILDIKCPESGMSHKNYWNNLSILRAEDEIKFVLVNREDYDYAKTICDNYRLYDRKKSPLFSPVHGVLDPKTLVQWILKDKIPVRLNLQLHKYIWDPTTKGV